MKFWFLFILVCLQVSASGQTVYRTPTGKKYHTAECRSVKNVSHSLSLREAKSLGLEACKFCLSTVGKISSTKRLSLVGTKSATKKPAGTDKGNQCRGTTKKGTRCRHYTRIGNDFCFQHTK